MNMFLLFIRKLTQKYPFLARLSPNLMSFQQRKKFSDMFVEAQFGYCPLV